MRWTSNWLPTGSGLFLLLFVVPPPQSSEIVLEGTITRADHGTYIVREFIVPEPLERLEVEYTYTHRGEGTALDIGLFDPVRFRGWSGSDKTHFFLARDEATPSYLPGDLPAGTWRIVLGVPHIRPDQVSRYVIRIRLIPARSRAMPAPEPPTPWVLKKEPGWYRGDLHAHSGHSDGRCRNGLGELIPCPIFRVAQAAVARGLDFLAITDHNTTSHHPEMRRLQAYFAPLLLIPGRELTTYRGHANVYGTSAFIDFRLGWQGRTIADILDDVRRAGGVISINHPTHPTGEQCMGCGWEDVHATDFRKVDMIEVINGNRVEGPLSGIPFWEARLNEGHRITGIGGSDDHRAGSGEHPDHVMGIPTTVVYATELSEPAILAGLKAGHVFIKTRGPDGPDLFLFAEDARGRRYMMGAEIPIARAGETVTLRIEVKRGAGHIVEIITNGSAPPEVTRLRVDAPDFVRVLSWRAEPRTWVRLNLRDERGIAALTNPIYFALRE